MVVKDTLRARQAEGTRQLLIATARELFTERGFAATSIEEIIQRAGVAKGALYHHFSGKADLFRAVYDAVQAEAVAGVVAAALAEPEPWPGARPGSRRSSTPASSRRSAGLWCSTASACSNRTSGTAGSSTTSCPCCARC